LTPKQRAKLAKLGIDVPADDSHEVGGHAPTQTSDFAESPLARVESNIVDELDGPAGPIAERFDVPIDMARQILEWHAAGIEAALRSHEAELLSVVVGGLLASKNVRITAGGLAFAAGMEAANNLGSQAQYARRLGVSRTILSKSVKTWKRDLNLRTTVWQKSDAACETYASVTKERHWRKAKTTATELARRLHILRKKP
jgi:hypothetical protein